MSDPRPVNCRHRLQDEGKPYPRSSCQACGATVATGLGTHCRWAREETMAEPALEERVYAHFETQGKIMSEHFNGLTPAEAERLAMLAEEAGEVVQAVTKVLRHGYSSHHPDGGPSNRLSLNGEVEDLLAVVGMMDAAGDIAPSSNWRGREQKKLRYAHHQTERQAGRRT